MSEDNDESNDSDFEEIKKETFRREEEQRKKEKQMKNRNDSFAV